MGPHSASGTHPVQSSQHPFRALDLKRCIIITFKYCTALYFFNRGHRLGVVNLPSHGTLQRSGGPTYPRHIYVMGSVTSHSAFLCAQYKWTLNQSDGAPMAGRIGSCTDVNAERAGIAIDGRTTHLTWHNVMLPALRTTHLTWHNVMLPALKLRAHSRVRNARRKHNNTAAGVYKAIVQCTKR